MNKLFSLIILVLCYTSISSADRVKRKVLPDGTIRFDIYVPSKGKSPNRTFYYDFGDVLVGQSRTAQLHWYTDSNVLTQTIHYVNMVGSSEIVKQSDGCTGADLHFGAPCDIYYVYTPLTKSVAKAALSVSWTNELPPTEDGGSNQFTSAVDTWFASGSSLDKPPLCPPQAPGSIVNVAGQTLGEKVNLIGVPFDMFYSSEFAPEYNTSTSQFTPNFGFNLQAWMISINHFYSPEQHRLFLGSGTAQSRQYSTLSNNNLMVTSVKGDEVYIFSPSGKHLETRTFLTGALRYVFVYDANDRVIKITDAYGKSTNIARSTDGNIVSIVGPFGQVTNFSTNSNGLLSSITNPNGEANSFTYKSGTGLLETFTKPGGQVTTFYYDSNGRLTKDLGHGGNFWELIQQTGGVLKRSQMGRQTSYMSSYDSSGNFNSTETTPSGEITTSSETLDNGSVRSSPYGQQETHTSDDARFGWIHKRFAWSKSSIEGRDDYTTIDQFVQYPDGVTPSPFNFAVLSTETKRNDTNVTDIFNNVTKTRTTTSSQGVLSTVKYDGYEKPVSVRLGSDVARTFNYNSLGQLVFAAQGPKNQTSFGYNDQGLLSSMTNGRSETTWLNYNPAGRMTSKISADGQAVQFGYDANGNITSLTPPNKPAHYFEYNAMELSSKYLPPALSGLTTKDTTFTYNLDKQLTTRTNPSGSALGFNYNASTGLLMSTSVSGITSGFGATTYLYNPNSNLVSQRTTGGTRQRFTYYGDTMKSEEMVVANTASLRIGKVAFDFDQFGRINSRTVTDRNDVHSYPTYYTYNNDNQPIRYGDMTLAYYPKNGRLSSTSMRSIKDAYVYDQYGALTKYSVTVSGTMLYAYELTRDNMNRITAKKETVQGVTKSYLYKYDNVGRLIEEITDGVSTASFVYDTNGNRTSTTLNGTTFPSTFDNQDRMLNFGANTYSYDADGNLIRSISSLGVQADFTRDINGDPIYIIYPGDNATSMFYDAQRRIVKKNINFRGPSDYFVYDHQNRIAAAFTGSGVIENVYHYPTGSHSPDILTIGYDSYRIIKDHLGSPRLVINTYNGAVVQKISYNILGKPTENTNSRFQPFAYAGGFYDDYTNFVRFGARDYDPETGRWLTKDPIGFAGGDTNLYGYVANDPVNFIDPTGLDRRICSRKLKHTPGMVGIVRHDFVEFKDSNGNVSSKSYGPNGQIPEDTNSSANSCPAYTKSSDKADKKAQDYADTLSDVMDYDLLMYNCQDYSQSVYNYQLGN